MTPRSPKIPGSPSPSAPLLEDLGEARGVARGRARSEEAAGGWGKAAGLGAAGGINSPAAPSP